MLHWHRTCLFLSRKQDAQPFPTALYREELIPARQDTESDNQTPYPVHGFPQRQSLGGKTGFPELDPGAKGPLCCACAGQEAITSRGPGHTRTGLRTCPTWAAAPPSPGARAFPPRVVRTEASIPQASRDPAPAGGKGRAPLAKVPLTPALVSKRFSPFFLQQAGPTVTLQGSSLCARGSRLRGVNEEWGWQGSC